MSPNGPDLAAVVLAAGRGSRLRPLTDLLPKPLCPLGDRALLDWALDRVRPVCNDIAVNVHHGRAAMSAHLAGLGRPVFVSFEREQALGTAGALGQLRPWIDGRPTLAANADAWGPTPAAVQRLVDGWDGERVRLLVVPEHDAPDFRPDLTGGAPAVFAGASVMPWSAVSGLEATPTGLYEVVWREAAAAGSLDFCFIDEPFFDCGTPASYLAANLAWSGGESVIGAGAVVEGEVVRSVVWPGAVVRPGERLVECIRAGADVTVSAAVGRSGP